MNFIYFIFLVFPIIVCEIHEHGSDDGTIINSEHCGERPLVHDHEHRIVGGEESINGDWAWQVALNYTGRFKCGGSLINSKWVVTAAHCIDLNLNPANYLVTLGLHDMAIFDNHTEIRQVSKIIMHPAYSKLGYRNDIALIKLSESVDFNDFILPVCIPDNQIDLNNKSGIATGWGTLTQGGIVSRYLMEVELPILTEARCKQKYTSVSSSIALCAGDYNLNKDTCQGDNGGPLVIEVEEDHDHEKREEHDHEHEARYFLAGITSWGYGCGDGGVFTRTSAFHDWISETVKNN